MVEMIKIKCDAKKRRAKFLAELERTGWTIAKLASKHGMTRSRMSQIICRARGEIMIEETTQTALLRSPA